MLRSPDNLKRKGVRSLKDISPDILYQLNNGQIASANLVEWLAIDQQILLKTVLQQNNKLGYFDLVCIKLSQLPKQSIVSVNQCIGVSLLQCVNNFDDQLLFNDLINHPSDAVRCWVCYMIGFNDKVPLDQKFEQIKTLANDVHFGVREAAWMAMRQSIIDHLERSLQILSQWSKDAQPNLRRFASEATRPRGVWCKHIVKLKEYPDLGLPVLSPLVNDESKYVQDSVANWLNDAAKSNLEFVTRFCEQYFQNNPSKSSQYMMKRALRSL